MQFRLVLVYVSICAVSSGVALPFRPEPHIVGSSPANNSARPVILEFDLSKEGQIVRSCYGVHFHPTKRRIYTEHDTYWILPAECVDDKKYDMIAVKHGYKDNTKARFNFKDVFHRIHPDYDHATKANNIAFVSLPFPAKMELKAGYANVQLPSETENINTETLEIFEYKDITTKEMISGDSQESDFIYVVKTKPIRTVWCDILYPFSPIKNNKICLSGLFGKGLSQANLGVPLIARDGNTYKLLGLATVIRPWTFLLSFPIEILRIQPYVDWIKTYSGER